MARYCFADIVAVDSDIITLLGPDGAAAVLHGSPRERRDGFLRAVAPPCRWTLRITREKLNRDTWRTT
jgi:hypothetical protein